MPDLSREEGSPPPEKPLPPQDPDDLRLTNTLSLPATVSLPREILVVALISLAQFTNQIGFGTTLPIIHVIGAHFGIENPGILSWLAAGYSLTVGTFILVFGRLGDLFGWKRLLVAGYAWFAVWSLVLGFSWYSDHVLFIFARALQGIGPSIAMPNGLALLGALYRPGTRKNMAFASFGACAPVGAIMGTVFGSLIALAWWPWVYWSFSITLTIIAVAAALLIPDPQDEKPGIGDAASWIEVMAELDVLGAVVGVVGLVLFNFAWNQAPIVGWQESYVIATLVLGVFFIVAFLWIELEIARNPLLPPAVFTSDNAFILGCIVCGWSTFGIWAYYLTQILEVIRGATPILTAAYFVPLIIAGGGAAISTGWLLGQVRPAWVITMALCAFLTGVILVATLPPHQVYWAQIFVTVIVMPFGMDMSFPAATIVVSNAVEKRHQGVAASLVNTVVNYSISLGLGFAGTVEVNVNGGGKTSSAILHGYRGALYMGIGLSGLGLLLAFVFLLKSYRGQARSHVAEDAER